MVHGASVATRAAVHEREAAQQSAVPHAVALPRVQRVRRELKGAVARALAVSSASCNCSGVLHTGNNLLLNQIEWCFTRGKQMLSNYELV